ncbi:DUF6193 family natural product biosynthesis protein [Streptomyces goshikiensis]|uniref:DUF6193 family natural product biosynthesis protein n=1 Tax=Streptomyces goshikiensis TaxID=1942 RepID=UPI003689D839
MAPGCHAPSRRCAVPQTTPAQTHGRAGQDAPFDIQLSRYLVVGPSRSQIVGEADTAEEAIALVVGGLPPGCGPAVVGRREELDRLDTVPPNRSLETTSGVLTHWTKPTEKSKVCPSQSIWSPQLTAQGSNQIF